MHGYATVNCKITAEKIVTVVIGKTFAMAFKETIHELEEVYFYSLKKEPHCFVIRHHTSCSPRCLSTAEQVCQTMDKAVEFFREKF